MLRVSAAIPCAVLGLLATVMVVPPSAPAAAAGMPTCHGEAATLVAGPGDPEVNGTEDDDVIVVQGYAYVSALGGDDLVCVVHPDGKEPVVMTGPGDDFVDATEISTGRVYVELGEGSDRFEGGAAADLVNAGDTGPRRGTGEHDVISSGSGSDEVVSGTSRTINNDEIRLAHGVDVVRWSGLPGSVGVVDGGSDRDVLQVLGAGRGARGETLLLDNRTGRGMLDGGQLVAWLGFEVFYSYQETSMSTTFLGGPGSEHFVAPRDNQAVRAEMGPGDDVVTLNGGTGDRILDFGPGADEIIFRRHSQICPSLLRGGPGPDRLILRRDACMGPVAMLGGAGADVLRGGESRDVLLGGPGHDIADGRQGRDRCLAEVRRNCE